MIALPWDVSRGKAKDCEETRYDNIVSPSPLSIADVINILLLITKYQVVREKQS